MVHYPAAAVVVAAAAAATKATRLPINSTMTLKDAMANGVRVGFKNIKIAQRRESKQHVHTRNVRTRHFEAFFFLT